VEILIGKLANQKPELWLRKSLKERNKNPIFCLFQFEIQQNRKIFLFAKESVETH